jgi:hypothetical protein
MNEDDILEEALKDPEVVKAGEELKDALWAHRPNTKCFGMTPIEAFQLCAEAFTRMKEKGELTSEQLDKLSKSASKMKMEEAVTEKPLTGRRAAVEHTKRKIEDGEN